jgi:hypothetical protein
MPYVEELLDDAAIRNTGIFDPRAVKGLVRRCRAGQVTSFAENQALVAVLSTQLWCEQFLSTAAVKADADHVFTSLQGSPIGASVDAGPRTVEQLC